VFDLQAEPPGPSAPKLRNRPWFCEVFLKELKAEKLRVKAVPSSATLPFLSKILRSMFDTVANQKRLMSRTSGGLRAQYLLHMIAAARVDAPVDDTATNGSTAERSFVNCHFFNLDQDDYHALYISEDHGQPCLCTDADSKNKWRPTCSASTAKTEPLMHLVMLSQFAGLGSVRRSTSAFQAAHCKEPFRFSSNPDAQKLDGDTLEARMAVCFTIASRCDGLGGCKFLSGFLPRFLQELDHRARLRTVTTGSDRTCTVVKTLLDAITVPFLSAANNPFDETVGVFAKEASGACLGNLVRPPDSKQKDLIVYNLDGVLTGITGEAKNHSDKLDAGEIIEVIGRASAATVTLLLTNTVTKPNKSSRSAMRDLEGIHKLAVLSLEVIGHQLSLRRYFKEVGAPSVSRVIIIVPLLQLHG
jgi:hypothetical protein